LGIIKEHVTKMYAEVEMQLHTLLILVLGQC